MSHPFYKPLSGLAYAWETKVVVASVGAALLEGARFVGALYGRLVVVEAGLLAAVFGLLVLDLGTGVVAARKRGERIQSRPLRRTGYKLIEYAALILGASLLTNAFAGGPFDPMTSLVQHGVLLYVATTEWLSVLENVTGSRAGARRLLRRITDLATGRTRTIEEVVTSEPVDPPEDLPPSDPPPPAAPPAAEAPADPDR